MDVTYTDPSYIPVYSLEGIPNSLLEVRTFVNVVKDGGTTRDHWLPYPGFT